MIKISKQDIEDALNLIDQGQPEAVGYRVMVHPLKTRKGLEGVEIEEFKHLAKTNFITQTDDHKEKVDKGTFYGIVLDVGNFAYSTEALGRAPWVEAGNVVITERYAGIEIEWPPGSGDKVRFINDESILGRMRKDK